MPPTRSSSHPPSAPPPPSLDRWGRLTWIAFILAVAVVLARAMTSESIRDLAPGSRGAGPTTGLILDLLACLPALLILFRRLGDGTYLLRWSWSLILMGAIALWIACSVAWASDRFASAISSAHFIAALALFWSATQLVRSWLRLRFIAAALLGLMFVLSARGFIYKWIDAPQLQQYWQQNRRQELQQRGWEEHSFQAEQFEKKIMSGEVMGFNASPNTYGALLVLLMVIAMGWIAQRAVDHRLDPNKAVLSIIPLLLLIAFAAVMIYYTGSKTAFITPLLAVAALLGLGRGHAWLARHAKAAYSAGVALIVLAAAALVGHGLYHGKLIGASLTFRWEYWVGSARIFKHFPILGVGWDNFGLHYLAWRLPHASEEIKDPHNFIVRFFVELGLIGGILLIAWMGRLWWELTRPTLPPIRTPAPSSARPGGGIAKSLLPLSICAAAATALAIWANIDFLANPGFAALQVLRRLLFFCLLLLGGAIGVVRSLEKPAPDDRPAPWVLYGMLVGLGLFLLHNMVDFSLFETGPLFVFALAAGGALGMRMPSVAGHKRHPQVVWAGCAVAVGLWVAAIAGLVAPTASAESLAHQAMTDLNQARAAQTNPRLSPQARQEISQEQRIDAAHLLRQASVILPMNGDYAYQASDALIRAGAPPEEVLGTLDRAIHANPLEGKYLLRRAEFELHLNPPDCDEAIGDFQQFLKLDPYNVDIRMRFADALTSCGRPADARDQYRQAIAWNQKLEPANPRRNDAPLQIRFADALVKMGKMDAAKQEYRAALQSDASLLPDDIRKISPAQRLRIEAKLSEK